MKTKKNNIWYKGPTFKQKYNINFDGIKHNTLKFL